MRRFGLALVALSLAALTSCSGPVEPGVSRIELDPGEIDFLIADTVWLRAAVYDARGRRIQHPDVRWRSPGIVAEFSSQQFHGSAAPITDDEAGARIRGVSLGEDWVVAESGGAADSVRVTVRGHRVNLTSVDAGDLMVCGLTEPGEAYCWGEPIYLLGSGGSSPGPTFAPAPVGGGILFERITVGHAWVCGLTEDGEAYCWGQNRGDVVLGSGEPGPRADPVRVTGGLRFVELSAGSSHTCGITAEGRLYCWGYHGYGQLGVGDEAPDRCGVSQDDCSAMPQPVAPELSFKHVDLGLAHGCAITQGGETYCWGLNNEFQLGHEPTDTCNFAGDVKPCGRTPQPVVDGPEFVALAAGWRHTCGLTADGEAYCWGHNGRGELGTGDTVDSMTPVPLAGGHRFQQVTQHCGLTFGGQAYCWGPNSSWANGTEEHEICPEGGTAFPCNLTPVPVSGGLVFRSITRAIRNGCGVTDDGVYCWGRNFALAGHGYWEPTASALPLKVHDGS